jgi:hypothetical protein
MTEAEWLAEEDVGKMLRTPIIADAARKKRLFAIACCWKRERWFPDQLLRVVLNKAELIADGRTVRKELDWWRKRARRVLLPKPMFSTRHNEAVISCTSVLSASDASCDTGLFYPYNEYPPNKYRFKQLFKVRFSHRELFRDIFGNPFHQLTFNPSWLTSTVLALANGIYQEKAFDRMPILADALQDAGCDNEDVLNHCRQPGEHVRGCWVIDSVTGRK